MNKTEKLNKVITQYFIDHPDIDSVKPKDLMPDCIKAGIFKKDNRNGNPIRKILRALDNANQLYLIPAVRGERKDINTVWSFERK